MIEANAERLEPDTPVLTRRLAHELRPQRVGPDLERSPARERHLVIAHHHRSTVGAQQIRPEPGDPRRAVQREPDEAAVAVGGPPLEAPRFVARIAHGIGG
jgi:hypothetical protein